jgi:dihydroneopterin aldolase
VSDIVFISGLQLDTVIGVYDWEREVRQRLLVDLEMAWDLDRAADSDDVDHALNYAAVSERLRESAARENCLLIERLAVRLAAMVMEEFGVPWLRLHLRKPGAVSEADTVGLIIERGQRPA